MGKKSLPVAAAMGTVLIAAQTLYSILGDASLLRPPGAQSEDDFIARCVSCGKCVLACPYAAIQTATIATGRSAGTPYIDARRKACRMCEGFPCVAACPTGALRDITTRADVRMGTAVINEDLCVVFTNANRCEVCYRVCPLIDQAISIDYRKREGDIHHVLFAPVINVDKCTGCGICVERCVISQPDVAIKIEPR
ncbi:MAG: 4Fe-4S dicluster domain-containing protein, partial [Coriobacteriia bacterium]|nr:4Fe-4S dicluster domain-containing protein [Coriobacteriia bacterium]